MWWGKNIKVYIDHKNLIRDALGLRSNRVYQWRLLLEEYGPKIVYIKGIHNTIADAISQLEHNPSINQRAESKRIQKQNWMTVSKHRCKLEMNDTLELEDHMLSLIHI